MDNHLSYRQRLFQSLWRGFCRLVVKVFYRRLEVTGLQQLPAQGPVLIYANHANALADAVIIQAISPRIVHPIVRSGLFHNPVLGLVLKLIQAVPVYREQDREGSMRQNRSMFGACQRLLEQGECLLIFPEGQSHSDSQLRTFKSGASRLVLSVKEAGTDLALVPVGLNFSHKGRFRSRVLVNVHEPVTTHKSLSANPADIRALTARLQQSLEEVTLNAESLEEADFLDRLERFFALRHGKYRRRSMQLRFRALKKLAQAQQRLRLQDPQRVARIRRQMEQFERLCRWCHIRDYQLTFRYSPSVVGRFLMRTTLDLALVLPVALWGMINSIVPFLLTRHVARLISRGSDQYDTAKMVLGLVFFAGFWSAQTLVVSQYYDLRMALLYLASVIAASGVALFYRRERQRIWEGIKVFFLFMRKRRLRLFLQNKRVRLERELAHLVRLSKQRPQTASSGDASVLPATLTEDIS